MVGFFCGNMHSDLNVRDIALSYVDGFVNDPQSFSYLDELSGQDVVYDDRLSISFEMFVSIYMRGLDEEFIGKREIYENLVGYRTSLGRDFYHSPLDACFLSEIMLYEPESGRNYGSLADFFGGRFPGKRS